jgi:hypothetical protein
MFRPAAVFSVAAVFGVAALLCAHPAAAQNPKPRFYIASSTGIDGGRRGPIFGATVPTAGGLFGVQLTDRVSVELEVDRGFHETARTAEAVWISLAQPGASRDEIERLGIRARFDRTQWVGRGLSAHVLWRTRELGRVNVGMLAGVSSRRYSSRVVRTPVSFGPGVTLPADHPYLKVDDSVRRLEGTGLTVGVVIFVRLTDGLAVAPDIRFTRGMITDDDYILFRAGTRVMWSF